MYKIETGKSTIEDNAEVRKRAWSVRTDAGKKAWDTANFDGIHIRPGELLKKDLGYAISSILTLNHIDNQKETYEIPKDIKTPNYGDNWGRRANYIEINPRLLAETKEVLLEDFIHINDYNNIKENKLPEDKQDELEDDLGTVFVKIADGIYEKVDQNRLTKDGKVQIFRLVNEPQAKKEEDYISVVDYAKLKKDGSLKKEEAALDDNLVEIAPDVYETEEQSDKINLRDDYIQVYRKDYRLSKGLTNTIKLLPAIPPSGKNIPNCIVISQIFPAKSSWHDSHLQDDGIYGIDLDKTLSKGLSSSIYTSDKLNEYGLKMSEEDLIKSFNDLAHLRGLKTCLRMPISEGQISLHWRDFSWATDTEDYINACCKAINLGFDAIYYDSGKHVGGYQMEHYCGNGYVPDYGKMQYINNEIRKRTGRSDIAISAEKAGTDPRFENLGYTVGHDWGCADDAGSLWSEYHRQKHNLNYAAGPVVSDDNDTGAMSYEQRLNRTRNAFSCFDDPVRKLPVHMQLHDIFPLNWSTNTHKTMMTSEYLGTDGTAESHYDNIFAQSPEAREHTMNMYHEFEKIMNR